MVREKTSKSPYYKKILPGVRGKARHDLRISNETLIKKDSLIIIQPLDPEKSPESKQTFKLTTYERDTKESDLPESQRDIIPIASYEIEIARPNDAFIFEEHYELSKEPLFNKNSPSLDEINQGQIPNCFLLAAIQAILNHANGADFLRGMMKQENDDTTTVRLFDPKTAEPIFINVPTAILVDKSGPLNRHKAPWIHVLETAYAALGEKSDGRVDSSASSVFSGGGSSSKAISILTGVPESEVITLKEKDNLALFRIDQAEINQIEPLQAMNEISQDAKEKIFYGVLWSKLNTMKTMDRNTLREENFHAYMNYSNFYQKNRAEVDGILQNEELPEADKLVHLINLASDKSTGKDNFDGAIKILKNAINHLSVPVNDNTVRSSGSAFSGYYSPSQHKAYQDMKNALESNQLVTCGTPDKFKKPVPGLRANHAYTVLDVFTRNEKAGAEERLVSYVKLRNPWGSTGRVYKQKEHSLEFQPVEDPDAAIFEIELSDFYENFSNIRISPSVQKILEYNRKERELRESIDEIQSYFANLPEITAANWLDFKEKYEAYEKNLLDLEKLHLEVLTPSKLADVEVKAKLIFDDQTISEEAKKESLIQIMMESDLQPPFYSGEEEQKYLQLYNLLKLSWLEKQDNLDAKAIVKVQAEIIDNANHQFCSPLKLVKQNLDGFTNELAAKLITKFTEIEELIGGLEAQVQDTNMENAEELFFSFMMLQEKLVSFTNHAVFIRKLGSDFNEKLDLISTRIHEIEKILAKRPRFEELSERYKTYKTNTLRAVNEAFCADGVTISELNQLEALIDKNDLEGLKSLPLLLNPSNEAVHESPERAEAVGYLKQLIEIAETCIDFIKNLLVDALNFIHKPEQGYFIGKEEAPEKVEKTENELYIGPFSRA